MLKKSISHVFRRLQATRRKYGVAMQTSKSAPALEYTPGYVDTLRILETDGPIPMYRLLDPDGRLLNLSAFSIEKQLALRMYKYMITLKEMDKVLYECQRQGRISFYVTVSGEEATVIGTAAGINADDLVFPQYREAGILLWRGFSIEQCLNQCFGNRLDIQKSKQMPVHYGSKEHNFVTISSPIATQIPQAAGAAYQYKISKNGRCVIAFFGDGGSSEGDTHAGLNFAATLECPVIFVCRNNGYAISTPVEEQFRGDGIAARALAYGISAMKVDGNDIFAVYHAMKVARDFVIQNKKPILLEAITYRKGHHSTSDDSLAYRTLEDINKWEQQDPISRLRYFLISQSWWNVEEDTEFTTNLRKNIMSSINKAEKVKKPKWETMFTDVYDELPEHIKEQKNYMKAHLKKFGEHYPMNEFEDSN